MTENKQIAKWGFGMAPISRKMQCRYDVAVQTALDLFEGNLELEEVNPVDLSELKGMFNRCLRQDQWDWFSVFTDLGEPDRKHMQQIVGDLKELRRAITINDTSAVELCKRKLITNEILTYLDAYQNSSEDHESGDSGRVYILSTREQPHILKIGMTRRSVSKRVKEINAATGVLIPFAARKVFRVTNVADAEREVFKHLTQYRIRSDREFFELPFSKAVKIIEQYIEDARMQQKKRGHVIWFDHKRKYGFISTEDSQNVFLHISQIYKYDVEKIQKGSAVEYNRSIRPQGICALDVRLIENE